MGRVEVLAGAGTVIRFGRVAIWAGPSASAVLVRWLQESARNVGGAERGGDQLADHIAAVLDAEDPEPSANFVTIGGGKDGLTALIHGPVQLWDGQSWITPPPETGWMRLDLAAAGEAMIGAGPLGVAFPAPHPSGVLDLEAGATPGGGLLIMPASVGRVPMATAEATATQPAATQPAATEPAAVARPPAQVAFRPGPPSGPVDLAAVPASPPRPELGAPVASAGRPVVRGVVCADGHFNHPDVTRCSSCGLDIAGDQRRLVSGNRPPLGVLLLDDGTIFSLDAAYVLGSDPARDPTVTGGRARPLTLSGDAVRSVSGIHAELRITDWHLQVLDRGSEHGTWVLATDGGQWARLPPYVTRVLPPGGHVAAGPRVLSFLSPWPAPAR